MAVLTNLGLLQYRAGYFSRCIPTYLAAWEIGRASTEPKAKALADRAAGEYVKMLARLGRQEELRGFLATLQDRTFSGSSTELIAAGRQGLALMEERPEIAFRCGPLALGNILAAQGKSPIPRAIQDALSTPQGISLAALIPVSQTLGLNYQAAKRSPGASLIVPSVVHWKVGHYAALLRIEGENYLTADPTFENETWHTAAGLEEESSGYFLVPRGALPNGWTSVSDAEARLVFGKGTTTGNNPDGTGTADSKTGGSDSPSAPNPNSPPLPPPPPPGENPDKNDKTCPMVVYSFHTMLVSLHLEDTPVGYRPPYGMPVYFTATYNQREAGQPSNFNYSNLGPKWTFNWLSYIVDSPAVPSSASLATAGGGTERFSGYDTATSTFATDYKYQSQLRRVSTAPVRYEQSFPNGSKDVFAQSDGSTSSSRKIFLTQRIDPAGNVTALSYDGQLRLTGITDALGQTTVLSYENSNSYLITKVSDPFGRQAIFTYDSAGRLIKIRDVIGIESQLAYTGTSDFINALTTPYGTTTFAITESGRTRRLTATDPQGDTEVLEFNENPALQPASEAANLVPERMYTRNSVMFARNSYFWDKKAWKENPNDYSKARLYHWIHTPNGTQANRTMESSKMPFENRVWYNYQGQTFENEGATYPGTAERPTRIGRRLDDGTTELTRFTYNAAGMLTAQTDPLGRTTAYDYHANGIDLKSVTQLPSVITAIDVGGSGQGAFQGDFATTGTAYATTNPIDLTGVSNPAPAAVYADGRAASTVSSSIGGVTPGQSYLVRLHFAETVNTASNQRVFHIEIGGNRVASDFDIFTAAGGKDRAVVREFTVTPSGSSLAITLAGISGKGNPAIAGIEVRRSPLTTPAAVLARYTYNSQHRPLTSTDASGQTTTYTWNPQGQLLTLTNPKGETTTFIYYASDVAGKQRKGRLASIEGALPGTSDTTTFDYDAVGRTASVTGPDGYTLAYAYDAIDRLTRTTFPDGTYTETNYRYLDPQTSRDRLGRVTTYVYNPLRQLAAVTDPANRTIQYKWCKCGDLQQLIDALGRVTFWRHDAQGRVTAKEYTDGSRIRYTYRADNGLLESIIDEKGQVKTYTYNLDQTLAALAYTKSEHLTPNVAYTYDPDYRRVVTMVDGIGTTRYAYNAITTAPTLGAGRLAAVDGPWANDTITYAYDSLGRVTNRAIDGVAEATAFDPAGRIATITNSLGAFTYAYDGATARLARATHDGGVAREFTYLPNAQDRRLQRIRNLKPDGTTPLSVFDYTYDVQGRITTWKQQQDNNAVGAQLWTLGYDAADQLTSNSITSNSTPVSTSAWTYDDAANRTSETVNGVSNTARYNALNELTTATVALPAITYEWDGERRLIAINQGAIRSEFSYDGLDRRVRILEKISSVVSTSKNFLWDGPQICQLRDTTAGVVQQRYFNQGFQGVSGNSTDDHLYLHDHLNSVREIVNTQGVIKERISYEAWGEPHFSNPVPVASFAFTGYFRHNTSGLSMPLFREYSDMQGRWLSRDPIAESGGLNLYSYVRNDPIGRYDPLGLLEFTYYKNYGGPGWTNGREDPNSMTPSNRVGPPWGPEPTNQQDSCYLQHDIDHKKCDENCSSSGQRDRCKRAADDAVRDCLSIARQGADPGSYISSYGASIIFTVINLSLPSPPAPIPKGKW